MHVHVRLQAENNHQVSVKVPLDFVPYLIGREGATIRKIREETDTRINVPMHSSDSSASSSSSSADAVTVVGKRKNVEDARSSIEALLKQFVRHSSLCLHPPTNRHLLVQCKHISYFAITAASQHCSYTSIIL